MDLTKILGNCTKSELQGAIYQMEREQLEKIDKMWKVGDTYTARELTNATGGFISPQGLGVMMCEGFLNGVGSVSRTTVHTTNSYVNVADPNDVITVTKRRTGYTRK